MKKLIIISLTVFMIFSIVGCGKKDAPADCSIVVAKESDGLDAGTELSAEDATSLMAQITAAEKENQWINAVSNSIASCYLSIETKGETTRYQYSDSGVLDDLTNMRSLTLTDATRDSVNELLSGYVDLPCLSCFFDCVDATRDSVNELLSGYVDLKTLTPLAPIHIDPQPIDPLPNDSLPVDSAIKPE